MSQRMQLLVELMLFGALGWLGAAWRIAKSQTSGSTQKFSWIVFLLQLPGALSCGIIGAAVGKYAFDISDQMVLAAFAVVAGKIGNDAVTTALVGRLVKHVDTKSEEITK